MKEYAGNIRIETINANDWLHILSSTEKVIGDISVDRKLCVTFDRLMYVTGHLTVGSDASLQARELKVIAGDLAVDGPARLDRLECVGRNMLLQWGLYAPSLKVVGGYIFVHKGYKLRLKEIPLLGGRLYIAGKEWDLREALLERQITIIQDKNESREKSIEVVFDFDDVVDDELQGEITGEESEEE